MSVAKVVKSTSTMDALLPIKKDDLSSMFIKEKRDWTIKAQGCAAGRSQWDYTRKEEVSSPTISIDALMIFCTIDAKEGKHIVITDIPGAFLNIDMEEIVHMLLGGIAELIVKLELKMYKKYIWKNREGKLMLYVQLYKALYGTL